MKAWQSGQSNFTKDFAVYHQRGTLAKGLEVLLQTMVCFDLDNKWQNALKI